MNTPRSASTTLPVETLLSWYRAAARDLPWRRSDATPWAILVSEVMLQQTPVVRVLPVYTEWMQRWPTPATLADATPADAVRAWGRLGYPRRALRLHQCAVVIDEKYDGTVPHDLDLLLALPGIGAYTARAVTAFAFQQRQAAVDVNIRRVLSRALDGEGDAGPATTTADFLRMESQLPPEGPSAATFVAAVMELGATVCTKGNPRCTDCPLLDMCEWRKAGCPAYEGPQRRQTYKGTDRQARGRLLAVLRDAESPVHIDDFVTAWPKAQQRDRALQSLIDDGLAICSSTDHYMLPS